MKNPIIEALAQRIAEYDSRDMSRIELKIWAHKVRNNLAGVYDEESKGMDKYISTKEDYHSCGCIGPQNGQPLCPCMMRGVTIENGRYVKKQDLGPVDEKSRFDFGSFGKL